MVVLLLNNLYAVSIGYGENLISRDITHRVTVSHPVSASNIPPVDDLKWINSTKRYPQNNLEDLQKEINRYHPLKF